jgi:hypothetical protein
MREKLNKDGDRLQCEIAQYDASSRSILQLTNIILSEGMKRGTVRLPKSGGQAGPGRARLGKLTVGQGKSTATSAVIGTLAFRREPGAATGKAVRAWSPSQRGQDFGPLRERRDCADLIRRILVEG